MGTVPADSPGVTPTETALTVLHIDRAARDQGLSLELPFSIEGLAGTELQERRLPTAVMRSLWETAVRELGDRSFPLRCADFPLSEARSVVLFACAAKETIGECIEASIRYWRLATEDLAWALEEHGDEIVLTAPAAGPSVGAQCAHEFHVIDAVSTACSVTGGSWAPREVRFSHAPGVPLARYEEVLGAPVSFGAPRVEIVISRDSLATPIMERTPAHVARFFEASADAMLARLSRPLSLVERARAVIASELDQGEPTLERTARGVAMSSRSLHRHLGAAGTSFREVLDQTRRERAMELLSDPEAELGAVAVALGFSDARAFVRAFKRWTGRTPKDLLACAA